MDIALPLSLLKYTLGSSGLLKAGRCVEGEVVELRKLVARLLNKMGLPVRECLLRAVCEVEAGDGGLKGHRYTN